MQPVMLTTERLILRRAHEDDSVNLFHHYHSDIDSSKFLTRKPYTTIEQTNEFLKQWCDLPWDFEKEKFAWVIALRDSNQSIGVILAEVENISSVQIHFGICSNFKNKGFITEATNEVVKWFMNEINIEKIWAYCDLFNYGSKRVLEKIGFVNERILEKKLTLPAFDVPQRDCYLFTYHRKK